MGSLGSLVASRIAREFRIGGPSFTRFPARTVPASGPLKWRSGSCRALSWTGRWSALSIWPETCGPCSGSMPCDRFRVPAKARPSTLRRMEPSSVKVPAPSCSNVLKTQSAMATASTRLSVVSAAPAEAPALPGATSAGRPLARAYGEAGIDRSAISFIEAGADGSLDDDCREIAVLDSFFGTDAPARSCAIRSVKGDIGHSGAASGLASLVSACLALHHEIIPACRGLESPGQNFPEDSPLYFPTASRYWLRNRADGPRRAGVNVSSVDGSCSHVVLEGYEQVEARRYAPLGRGVEWLFAVAGKSSEELMQELDALEATLSATPDGSLYGLSADCCQCCAASR